KTVGIEERVRGEERRRPRPVLRPEGTEGVATDHDYQSLPHARGGSDAGVRALRRLPRRPDEGVMAREREQLSRLACHHDVVAIERKRLVHGTERLVAHGAGDRPRWWPPERHGAGRRVFEHPVANRDPGPL